MMKYLNAADHEDVCTREDIPVRFDFYHDSNHLITSHWHNSMEVICLYKGQMDVTVNNRKFCLKPGEFVIINSADVHSTYCHEDGYVILLQIPYDFLKKEIPDYDQLRFEPLQNPEAEVRVRDTLYQMKELNSSKSQGYSLYFTSLIYQFLYLLVTCYQTHTDIGLKARTEKNLLRLQEVTTFVRQNYAYDISLEDAARVMNLNPEYFCRFFKKYMGTTFMEYVMKVRLSHVFHDLMHTDLSITQILSKNGCFNYKLFMRYFKNTYGCTPMQMRKYQQENRMI